MSLVKAARKYSWIKNILIHDLIRALENINKKSVDDLVAISKLQKYLKGDWKTHRMRGTPPNTTTSQGYCQGFNIFHFLRELWSPKVTLVLNTNNWRAVNNTCFGACTSQQGMQISYVFIDGRQAKEGLPAMPWSNQDNDLGIGIWNFNTFSEPEIIEAQCLCGLFALAEISLPDDHRGWVTISLNHLTQEPEVNNSDDEL
ncbi:hypothetical protein HETIRDRAFT_116183 [Heterobasidion irregulare TC 32-1]|uniref:Uncharacterized protein n=1 Tax=Heterobasidion irregulare (strain TC 32-1) TaxID=747525 RepID=W4K5U6_HETIT|nr:uncharacterized protein HETIRDRAFT_116183 [Heterobasidion irregulare TC 32-1]ETW81177.1 hypothetical protein HETIRDRAFT_116183 [Heterobasidion irregulare TC 32-1]